MAEYLPRQITEHIERRKRKKPFKMTDIGINATPEATYSAVNKLSCVDVATHGEGQGVVNTYQINPLLSKMRGVNFCKLVDCSRTRTNTSGCVYFEEHSKDSA